MNTSDAVNVKEVGEEIEAFCTYCKMDLTHVVVAKKSGLVRRVRCVTCAREHNFRTPRRLLSKKGKKADSAEVKEKKAAAKKQLPPLGAPDSVTVKKYSFIELFVVGDWIDHTHFGFGEVVALRGKGKMEVRFNDAVRILICGTTPAPTT